MSDELERQLELIKRGAVDLILLEDLVRKLKHSLKEGEPLRIKVGFDPTAPDLHLGHTVLIQKMKHFQDLGHQVVFLIGDFTGMVGDPSQKSETRKAMTREQVLQNADTYQKQIYKILDRERTVIDFNSRWLGELGSEGMLRLTAQYTVARMLERDDFSKRFAENRPISIHEFMYPLLQGYDSVALKTDVELGGTDQKFNLLVGRDLQRAYGQEPQVILTMPLLEGTDGVKKMSKTENNYIGIDEPPREIYGKIMSINDELMWRYYELLSDTPAKELEKLRSEVKSENINPRVVKAKLAREMVARFHGKAQAQTAEEEFERVFRAHGLPDEVPRFHLKWDDEKMWLPRVTTAAGMTKSTSEAKRLIIQGAVYVNGEKINDSQARLDGSEEYLIKVGKRRVARIIPQKS
jgi:tyrosyl-tRNA synthetase